MRILVWTPLLLSCRGDNIIEKQENIAPTISIQSHGDGTEIQEGFIEQFRAQVSDDDDDFADLSIAWYIGEELICDWTAADPAGVSYCDMVFMPDDTRVVAEVRDQQGAGARDEIDIAVLPTEAPVGVVVSPIQNNNYYSDQLIQFSGLVSDLEDDPSDLIISWSSSVDGELPLDTEPDTSGEISDFGYLLEGQHAIELRVEDSTGKISSESVVINVGGENSLPQCEILSPANLTAVVDGDTVILEATATDEDIPNDDLLFEFSSDKDGVLGAGNPVSSGLVTYAYDGLSVNTHTIRFSVTDEVEGTCSASILVVVGNSPTVSINDPLDGDVFSVGQAITFQGTVTDNEDLPSEIAVSWMSSLDGELSTQSATSQGVSQFSSSSLSAGVHSVILSGMDTDGLTSDDLITFRVNTPPTAPIVSISPNPADSNDALIASVSGSVDADGDNITYSYQWFENGVATSNSTASVAASDTAFGEIWMIRVTPNDGTTDGNYTEESIIIANSPPIMGVVSISPSSGVYNDTAITCSASASDPDETVTPTYQWTVNGSTYMGASLDLANVSILPTESVTCTAMVTDSAGESDQGTATIMIGNRLPTISTPVITPSTVFTDSMVTCAATPSDVDGETLSVIYEWTVNGTSIGSTSTLTLDASVVQPNDALTCTAVVADGYGGVDSDSDIVLISNSDPIIESLSLAPTSPSRMDSVTCTATTSDVDGGTPSLSFTFANQNTGMSYAAASNTSESATVDLSATSIQPSHELVCSVIASDVDGGSAQLSTTVEVINTAPVFDVAASISPNAGVVTGMALTCSALVTDPDDGAITPTYSWINNGILIASGSSYTVSAVDSNVGDGITCMATAIDSDGETTTSSDVVVVDNTVPVVSAVSVTPSSAVYNDSVLTCSGLIVDPDETLVETYGWTVNGVLSGTGYMIDLATTAALPGDQVNCTISAADSQGASDSDSVSVTLDNRLPSAPLVSITPSSPEEGVDDITCSIDAPSVDADGDAVSYTYGWTQNGASTSQSSDVVSSTLLVGGDVWECMVTPNDGYSDGVAGVVNVTIGSNTTIGQDSSDPGLSCFDIISQDPSAGNDVYWIAPNNGTPFQVYCEMTIDGGGWTVQSYIRDSSQWNWGLTSDSGTVGDIQSGFASGATLSNSNIQVNEKIIIYLKLIEYGSDLGTQWMINTRSGSVTYSNLSSTQTGWDYYDSFGATSSNAGNVCTHGCNTYRGFGMFHEGSSIGYHGTQTGDYGCRDGNNICWVSRSGSCNVGSDRCSYLTGTGEGVIYAIR